MEVIVILSDGVQSTALNGGRFFKRPFGGLAAMEPGIDPALKWKDPQPRNKFWRGQDLMEAIFGKPFDKAYWEANNVATIAASRAEKLRTGGLGIYIEAGDEDMFYLLRIGLQTRSSGAD